MPKPSNNAAISKQPPNSIVYFNCITKWCTLCIHLHMNTWCAYELRPLTEGQRYDIKIRDRTVVNFFFRSGFHVRSATYVVVGLCSWANPSWSKYHKPSPLPLQQWVTAGLTTRQLFQTQRGINNYGSEDKTTVIHKERRGWPQNYTVIDYSVEEV